MSTQQGTDGRAHITYFDKQHQVSFVWDGTNGDLIDVSVGGYAEPTIALIPCEEFTHNSWDKNPIEMFENRCKRFIREMFAYDEPVQ